MANSPFGEYANENPKISVTWNEKITDINAPVMYSLRLDNELWVGICGLAATSCGNAFILKPDARFDNSLFGIKWCPDQKHFEVTVDGSYVIGMDGSYILAPPSAWYTVWRKVWCWNPWWQGWCNKPFVVHG